MSNHEKPKTKKEILAEEEQDRKTAEANAKRAEIQEEINEIEEERSKADAEYTGENIQVLEGLEAVRKRPGMYIATTSSAGLHHLVWEIIDNGIDEVLAHYANLIEVTLNKDGSVSISDNGRGIPVDNIKGSDISALETVYTKLHAGGKFGVGGGYKVSGGLHGVGAAVVNALSEWLEVHVYRGGQEYYVRFEDGGKTVQKLTVIGKTDKQGTLVTFKPDSTIFTETTTFDYGAISKRCKQMAYLNRKLKIRVTDDREEKPVSETFYYEGGIIQYVADLNKNKQPMFEEVIYCVGADDVQVAGNEQPIHIMAEVALQYNNEYNENIYSFTNNIFTKEGGTHLDGFRLALGRTINKYARSTGYLKENDDNFETSDTMQGLTAIVSVKHPNPQYEGQTKTKLGNSEVRRVVSQVVGEQLEQFLLENPKIGKKILDKINSAAEERNAIKRARENVRRKSALDITTLPGKLADCSSKNPEECELFIVEGNSAGGSAKNGRDRHTQAILPLRGKILNVQKARQKRIFDNAEIGNIISAIGAGMDPEFDISKIRYHKIVIMTDADVDGAHIRVLLLTFFNRFMHDLLAQGNVYVAQPPLYKLEYRGKPYYAYSDHQLQTIKDDLGLRDNFPFQRYKGLGEMNADQLWETTMNPENRKLVQITLQDGVEADEVFENLMGDDVEPRREFIINNAKKVKNLDV